jgi:hypothetical protein
MVHLAKLFVVIFGKQWVYDLLKDIDPEGYDILSTTRSEQALNLLEAKRASNDVLTQALQHQNVSTVDDLDFSGTDGAPLGY